MRRFAFHELRADREQFAEFSAEAAPAPLAPFKGMAGLYGRAFTALRFGAGSSRASDGARVKILAAVDKLEAELGDREYLAGDHFSVADLTAAALFYPLVMPPEGPRQWRPPEGYARVRDPLLERRGIQWVAEMFRRHRKSPLALAVPAGAA